MPPIIDQKILMTQPSSIRVVFERVLQRQKLGERIIRLDIGSPNFKAPDAIVDATCRNLQEGRYRYSSNWGLESLRAAISKKYLGRSQLEYDFKNEVIITNGASEAVAMVICGLLNGDEHFLIPTPAWPHYVADCHLFGKKYKEIPTDFEDNFKLTPDKLTEAIDGNSKVLMLNSPGNPTGCVYSPAEFNAINDICVDHQILLVLDEIYEDINFKFTGSLLSAGVEKSNVIYINGFSKNFAMTGFRLGFLMAEANLAKELIKYHQYTNVCGQEFVQQACAEFLADEASVQAYQKSVLACLKESREILNDYFQRGRIQMTSPQGAFYSFAKVPEKFSDAKDFCMRALAEKRVSLVPGDAFGIGYENFYRISYGSVTPDELQEALEKISEYY